LQSKRRGGKFPLESRLGGLRNYRKLLQKAGKSKKPEWAIKGA